MRISPERTEHPDHLHPPRAPIRTVIREAIAKKWTSLWKDEPRGSHLRRFTPESTKETLTLHRAIYRSTSSIITQTRTRKIGLGDFLHGREVPGSVDPQRLCRQGRQTMSTILRNCRKFRERERERMWATEQVDESGDHHRSPRVIGLRALLTVPNLQ
jgi:hypothetical protein